MSGDIGSQKGPSCFPPLPDFLGGNDWCKAKGGSTPPPWGENPYRGDQSAGAALAGVPWWIYAAAALFGLWLVVRAYEAYKQ